MTIFYLIRHGETQHNINGGITGQMDIPLNLTGKRQAEELANRLEKGSFDAVYSSDLERTLETIEIIADRHSLSVEECKEFREMDFGVLEGEPKEVFRSNADESKDSHFYRPNDGESSHDAGERFLNKLDELREEHVDERILIGGHSVVMKSVLMEILGLTGRYYRKLNLGNTSITELKYNEELGWSIVRVNDTAHLE